MKIAGQFPAPLPRQLWRNYSEFPDSSDIPAAAIATAERRGASIVGIAHRIAHHSAHPVVHLKAGNLIPQGLDFIGLNKCPCCLAFGVYRRRDVARLTVYLCRDVSRRESVVAAIVLSQRLFILCFLRFPVRSDYIFTLLIGVGYSCRDYWYLSSPVSR